MTRRRELDPYAVLGVPRGATSGQITRAFRQLVRVLHPDVAGTDLEATGRFAAVSAAYELLRDPERRAAYDARTPIRRPQQRPSHARRRPSSPTPPIVAGPVRINRPGDRRGWL